MKYTLLLSACLLLAACGKTLEPAEYVGWFADARHGTQVKTTTGNFEYTLEYRTPAYMALQQLGMQADQAGFDSVYKDYRSHDYYLLKIRNIKENKDVITEGRAGNVFSERLRFYAEEVGNSFALVNPGDTLFPSFTHLERTYNITPFTTILLSFERNGKDYREILFQDMPNKNLVRFTFDPEQLKNIPALSLVKE